MGIGAGLYMYVVVVQKFKFAISSPDEFLFTLSSLPLILPVIGRHRWRKKPTYREWQRNRRKQSLPYVPFF